MKYLTTIFFCFFLTQSLFGQELIDSAYIATHYTKSEYEVKMRDGIKLFTTVYEPKDQSKTYPVLMKRTCYSVRPYGEDNLPTKLGPSSYLLRSGYIFVYQDVRGRWMSEGDFDNMRPNVKGKKGIDESSDTYDTIEWLLKNIKNNNGKVGQWGISYPGFYTAAALPDAHPALVASSPQAPIADFYFDDFHHNGAFTQGYLLTFPVFGEQTDQPTQAQWYGEDWKKLRDIGNMNDGYAFGLSVGPLKNITEKVYTNNFFWKQHVEHPDYDEFWQARDLLPHLRDIDHAVLVVGGWFDSEDLYGPLNIYKTIDQKNPEAKATLVMGPWTHGDWARNYEQQIVNHIYFGDGLSDFYQKTLEFPFFEHHLKGAKDPELPAACLFDTGKKEWKYFTEWPSKEYPKVKFSFAPNEVLLMDKVGDASDKFTYTSDPMKPVPYRSEIEPLRFTPRPYMTDDQRHASYRPDVLTFKTDVLEEDFTLAGELLAKLKVAISTTDADFVVKVIDVYPDTATSEIEMPKHVQFGGYQQLVRAEVFRGKYREDFAKPKAFTPNKPTNVEFRLQDVLHTFKAGHRVMIQIHSTWFPYIDRNPQQFIKNIFEAEADDFIKSEITIFGNSTVEVK
ncbi:MAG: CocE/NonD family hydrolase [Bacteroidota bacterium]